MTETRLLQQLPVDTRNKIRSTQILTSLPQIISELLQNSLDAGARQIDIGVDCEEWTCWVRDDGTGMSREGMELLAKGRYGTSKAYEPGSIESVSTFGFRGEALASAGDLSCLEISSRPRRSRETWSVIIKGGKKLYSGAAIRWRRESAGTTVYIRDAFFSLPVRRVSHPSPSRTLDMIRQEMDSFSLVFPSVTFSLENLAASRQASVNALKHIFRIPKTDSTVMAFRHLYGRALVEHIEEIHEVSGILGLDGFISLDGAHSKTYQFLYINKHPVASSMDLHRIIDTKFAQSTFMKNAYGETGESRERSTTRRSPRKTERRPVYVLNLTVPPQQIDNCLDPAKLERQLQNKPAVSAFLATTIQTFLLRHGFTVERRKDEPKAEDTGDQPSPAKRRRLLTPKNDKAVRSTPIVREDSDDENEELPWVDSNTGKTFIVNKRTGNSYIPGSRDEEGPSTNSESRRRTLQARGNTPASEESVPRWIRNALEKNQVYTLTEPRVPSIPLSSQFGMDSQGHSCDHGRGHRQQVSQFFDRDRGGGTTMGFTKEDLQNARVINQVDRKFIACVMNGGSLVLIDQHAADERVRVERFLKEVCVGFLDNRPNVQILEPPRHILLTRHETERLGRSKELRDAFASWGFEFDLARLEGFMVEGDAELAYVQISVSAVPALLSDKLLMGDELRELVKGFIATLERDGSIRLPTTASQRQEGPEDSFGWLKALRWCPKEMVDLINSKACRGAIMFNDALSINQCEELVQALSQTAFPFQCAHGRPSLVPLVNFGERASHAGGCRTSFIDWSRSIDG